MIQSKVIETLKPWAGILDRMLSECFSEEVTLRK